MYEIRKDPISFCVDTYRQFKNDWNLHKELCEGLDQPLSFTAWIAAIIKLHIVRLFMCNFKGHDWTNETEDGSSIKVYVCNRCGLLVSGEDCKNFGLGG